ncbi:lactate dehydrogenase [Mucilaginibacter ximonensis]|uniref:Lactate dehydrogenase n=1 Tax=Mucilaginibacter ximonensis TaxID=538021 RepID=A0ABW5YC25_9SPHI
MKVIAYSITPTEKEYLAKANQKKHDITLISNPLGMETVAYAAGKDAVIIWNHDDVSAAIIDQLAALNVRFIITGSIETNHIDKTVAAKYGIKLSNVSTGSPQEIADQLIQNLDLYQQNKCLGDACVCAKSCRAAKN